MEACKQRLAQRPDLETTLNAARAQLAAAASPAASSILTPSTVSTQPPRSTPRQPPRKQMRVADGSMAAVDLIDTPTAFRSAISCVPTDDVHTPRDLTHKSATRTALFDDESNLADDAQLDVASMDIETATEKRSPVVALETIEQIQVDEPASLVSQPTSLPSPPPPPTTPIKTVVVEMTQLKLSQIASETPQRGLSTILPSSSCRPTPVTRQKHLTMHKFCRFTVCSDDAAHSGDAASQKRQQFRP